MIQGVGLHPALWSVASRFGQRAVEEFFTPSRHHEFVLDAYTAVEHAAKAAVATEHPDDLFRVRKAKPLTSDELAVIGAAARPDIVQPARDEAICSVLDRRTITAEAAVERANELGYAVDIDAETRLRRARNRVVHLGAVDDSATDGLARDFIDLCNSLSPTWRNGLFGSLQRIATTRHMTSARSLTDDAEARVIVAAHRWWGRGPTERDRLGKATPYVGVRCPACTNRSGVRSSIFAQDAPELAARQRRQSERTDAFDCLLCGLSLFGADLINATIAAHTPPSEFHPDTEYP